MIEEEDGEVMVAVEVVVVKVKVAEVEEVAKVEVGGPADVEVVHVGHGWEKKEKGNPS